MMNQVTLEWVQGRASLGAAGGWTAEEMRLVADIGYALAEQGRNDEAITVFEGLAALAPATGYFQAALGALWLRQDELERAIGYLDAALSIDARDVTALVNRGEAYMRLGNRAAARRDFRAALQAGEASRPNEAGAQGVAAMCLTRARALLLMLENQGVEAEAR